LKSGGGELKFGKQLKISQYQNIDDRIRCRVGGRIEDMIDGRGDWMSARMEAITTAAGAIQLDHSVEIVVKCGWS